MNNSVSVGQSVYAKRHIKIAHACHPMLLLGSCTVDLAFLRLGFISSLPEQAS